jgi:hypothetical protein
VLYRVAASTTNAHDLDDRSVGFRFQHFEIHVASVKNEDRRYSTRDRATFRRAPAAGTSA